MLSILAFALFFIAAFDNIVLTAIIGIAIGLIVGYVFRAAIAADLSKIKISTIISDLETAADRDVETLKTAAMTAAASLRKVL